MRPLTQQLATACETAHTSPLKCKCRCNGGLHGLNRHLKEGPLMQTNPTFYLVQLPPDDPHWVKNKRVQLRLPDVLQAAV